MRLILNQIEAIKQEAEPYFSPGAQHKLVAMQATRQLTRGFTFLELVAVLLVIGVLAAFALPRVLTQSINLSAISARLASDLRYTQSLAMSQGQRYRVNFTSPSYQISDMGGTPVSHPITGTALITVTPATFTVAPATANISFDTKGVPYDAAGVALAANVVITLTAGSDTSTLTITPVTGRVQ